MKILVNRKIKKLFRLVLLITVAFTLISATFIGLRFKNAALCILAGSLCMSISILVIGYRYFKEQNIIIKMR